MKVLVTGSTGFVGSHLCERLHQTGHQVFALARSLAKFQQQEISGTLIHGSLATDQTNNWIDHLPPDLDAVIHTAGVVHSFCRDDFHRINAEASLQLIKDLKSRYPRLKFILISSLAAIGPTENNIHRKEEHVPRPPSEYGRSKLRAEEYLQQCAPENWETVIIRPPMVIGPGDPAVLDIFKMVKSGVVLLAGMNASQKKYSYVCVYDLVEVIKRSLETEGLKNEIFFASHHEHITLEELIATIRKKMDKKRTMQLKMPLPVIKTLAHTLERLHRVRPIEARLTPDKIHEITPDAWTCCSEKSRLQLNYTYSWDLENTIEVTLEDYRQRGWL